MTDDIPNVWRLPPLKPQPGGFYQLRAGLVGFVSAPVELAYATAQGEKHVIPYWKGILLDAGGTPMLWYGAGSYSPVRGARHELDIIAELA